MTLPVKQNNETHRTFVTVPVAFKTPDHIIVCICSNDETKRPLFMKVLLQHAFASTKMPFKLPLNSLFDTIGVLDELDKNSLRSKATAAYKPLYNCSSNPPYHYCSMIDYTNINIGLKKIEAAETFSEICAALKMLMTQVRARINQITKDQNREVLTIEETFRSQVMARVLKLQNFMFNHEELNSPS